jgi:hypothetical protein
MEIRTAFGAIYALYPVLARVQAEIARNSNAIKTSSGAMWKRFSVHIGRIPGQMGRAAYGSVRKCSMGRGSFHYLSGVEVCKSSVFQSFDRAPRRSWLPVFDEPQRHSGHAIAQVGRLGAVVKNMT